VSGLEVPNDGVVRIALEVTNHAHNLQIPLDDKAAGLNVHVRWSAAKTPTAQDAPRAPRAPPYGLGLLSGTGSRGLSMARTLGSEEADQVTKPGRKVLIGWTGGAPSGIAPLRGQVYTSIPGSTLPSARLALLPPHCARERVLLALRT
jgi:hypothetical protein